MVGTVEQGKSISRNPTKGSSQNAQFQKWNRTPHDSKSRSWTWEAPPASFLVASVTTPDWFTLKQHSSVRNRHNSPSSAMIRSRPHLFFKATEAKEFIWFCKVTTVLEISLRLPAKSWENKGERAGPPTPTPILAAVLHPTKSGVTCMVLLTQMKVIRGSGRDWLSGTTFTFRIRKVRVQAPVQLAGGRDEWGTHRGGRPHLSSVRSQELSEHLSWVRPKTGLDCWAQN